MRPSNLALAIALALVPAAARAGSTDYTAAGIPLHWQRATLPFAVDAAAAAGAPFDDLLAITQRAADAWAAAPNAPRVEAHAAPLGSLGYDNRGGANASGVTVYRDGPPPGMNPNVLAVTLVTVRAATGEILDADVVVNAWRHRFAAMGPEGMVAAPGTPYDLQNVLAHEFGHVLGLGEDFEESDATMAPSSAAGEVSKRDIAPSDVESVRVAYNGVVYQGPSAGCGGARVAPLRANRTMTFGALAVALLALAAARSRMRNGAVVAAAGALLVVAAPAPSARDASALTHTVRASSAEHVGNLLVTRASVVDASGAARTVTLIGGRDGEIEVRAYDAPSGADLVPGASIELDDDRVVRVVAPPAAR